MVVKAAGKSTTRYFYTDPLAAAWMGQHFNMVTYIGRLPDDWDAYGQPNWHQCVDDWKYRQEKLKQPAPKFYLHPESLNLLEPQVGDLLRGDEQAIPTIRFMHLPDSDQMGVAAALMRRGFKIIQRKGKAFHWPESEAV